MVKALSSSVESLQEKVEVADGRVSSLRSQLSNCTASNVSQVEQKPHIVSLYLDRTQGCFVMFACFFFSCRFLISLITPCFRRLFSLCTRFRRNISIQCISCRLVSFLLYLLFRVFSLHFLTPKQGCPKQLDIFFQKSPKSAESLNKLKHGLSKNVFLRKNVFKKSSNS